MASFSANVENDENKLETLLESQISIIEEFVP